MANNVTCIKTERLILKNICKEDADNIVKWRSDPKVYCYFLSPHLITVDEHMNWFTNNYLNDENRIEWMAFDQNNQPVGVFGIRRQGSKSDVAEISYILAPEKKGKGYASEAIGSILSFLGDVWNCKYVIAEIHVNNIASIKFAKKQGMILDSIKEPFLVYKKELTKNRLSNKKIYIRVDGNGTVGMGHVMRCLSIAYQLRVLGANVTFIVADNSICNMIERNSFSYKILNTNWNSLEEEVNCFSSLILENNVDAVVVDSYYVTEKYLMEIRRVSKIYYIDDLCMMQYPVDGLINYNLYAENMEYDKFNYNELYLGTKYVPLRSEFVGIKSRGYNNIKNILITSGGTDQYNVVGNILDSMRKKEKFNKYHFFCVLGKFNNNLHELNELYKESDNVHFLVDINNMSDYMKMCDIAITAGGTTCYELCAVGVPSIVYTLADNQLNVAKTFSQKDIIPYVGDVRHNVESCMQNIDNEIEKLENKIYWEEKSKKMQDLVDGFGAQRIASAIIN